METQIDLKEFLQGTNKKGLASFYDKEARTMRKWIKPHAAIIGKIIAGYYTPKQMIIILKVLGPPPRLTIPEDQLEELYRAAA